MIPARVEVHAQPPPARLLLNSLGIWPCAVDVHRHVLARAPLMLVQAVQQLGVALGPQHLAQEVHPLLEGLLPLASSLCLGLPHPQEGRGHAMDEHGVLAGQRLHSIAELDDLVTVHAAHPRVDVLEQHLLHVAVVLAPGVVQVVGVHHAHHMVEFVGPTRAMVVPVQVLRLLQYCHIGLMVGDDGRDVAHWQDAPLLCCIAPWVEGDLEVAVQTGAFLGPLPHKALLLLRALKLHAAWEHAALVSGGKPRQDQCDLAVAFRGQVCSTQQGIHSCARQPGQGGSRNNGHLTPWVAYAPCCYLSLVLLEL
mmetsp:Transcript_21670/g.60128  ORF Transcript_21670/g.60128 Transcript_21670/m.60128 type:complete len:309 (-) Transcript_21670:1513-2439(-)